MIDERLRTSGVVFLFCFKMGLGTEESQSVEEFEKREFETWIKILGGGGRKYLRAKIYMKKLVLIMRWNTSYSDTALTKDAFDNM